MAYEWLPYAMMMGGQLMGNLGSSDAKQVGTAQSPGDAWLQGMIQPGMTQSLANLYQGGSAYPVPQAPQANYQLPQAPYASPYDMIQSGEMQTAQNLREQFYGGGGGGSAMGGVSGQGQVFDSNLAANMAQGATSRYAAMQLPYDQMLNQQGQLGYQGQLQEYGYQNAAMNPYQYYGMYPGVTGNPMIQPSQQDPWAQALQTGMMMYGMNSMGGTSSPFGSALAGAGASNIGAGYGVGGAVGTYGTGAAASTYGTGAGLGSYAAGMEGAGAGSSMGASGATGLSAASPGALGIGAAAAALVGYGAYDTWKHWGEETGPGGTNYIQSYLQGVPKGGNVAGFQGVMPGQNWWNNPSNIASVLSVGDLRFDPSNPLVKMVQNKEITYDQLGALMNQYGTYSPMNAGG